VEGRRKRVEKYQADLGAVSKETNLGAERNLPEMIKANRKGKSKGTLRTAPPLGMERKVKG